MSAEFLITAFIVVLMPGTGVVYTLGVALGRGFPDYAVAALGCTLGIVPHIALSLSGAAALLAADPQAFTVLEILGAGYLLYMAWGALMQRGSLTIAPRGRPAEAGGRAEGAALRVARDAVLLNLLNPKLTLFFLAFLPQFVDPGRPDALAQSILLSAIFMAMTAVVFLAYGALADRARRLLSEGGRAFAVLRVAFAAAFALLARRLVLAEL